MARIQLPIRAPNGSASPLHLVHQVLGQADLLPTEHTRPIVRSPNTSPGGGVGPGGRFSGAPAPEPRWNRLSTHDSRAAHAGPSDPHDQSAHWSGGSGGTGAEATTGAGGTTAGATTTGAGGTVGAATTTGAGAAAAVGSR